MTKSLIRRKELEGLSPTERRTHFLDTYQIRGDELQKALSAASMTERLVRVGALIYEKSLPIFRGKPYNNVANRAIAQITTRALAIALGFEGDLEHISRKVGNKVSKCFRETKIGEEAVMKEQGYNVRLSNMFALRKAAYRQQTGHDLETNIEKVMRFWGDTVKFSPHDLTYGTFIPERVDPVVAFLLGIYRAKANVKREDFTISIAGAKGSKLYEDLVIPLIDDLFEIDAYKSDEAVIDVTSRAHFSWLELIGFQRNDFPRWEKIPLKNRTRDQSLLDRAYFMGMFAALMNPQRYENEYPYGWQSQERSAEFEIAGRKAGYRIVHNANGAFLTRDETVKLMQQLGLRGLKVEHIGGIYNPEHIRFMCEDFVRSQYLFVPKPK